MVNKHKQTKKGSEGSEDLRNSCCNNKYKSNDSTGWKSGLLYGLIPHIGCIAFIIGSILGVTVLMQFFKPLLMNRYFFHSAQNYYGLHKNNVLLHQRGWFFLS